MTFNPNLSDRINIFSADELAAANAPVDLPPPGHARDEELRRRTDTLEQRAEQIFENVGTVDPEVFKKDREIQDMLLKSDGLEITHRQPGYMYCWVNYVNQQANRVWQKKALGWEMVQGNLPECVEFKREDGTRRIGDVLLMRIRMDFHMILEQRNEERRRRQQLGVSSEVRRIAQAYPKAFGQVQTSDEGGPLAQTVLQRGEATAAAQRTAAHHVDAMLRRGTVPGLGTPGRQGGGR